MNSVVGGVILAAMAGAAGGVLWMWARKAEVLVPVLIAAALRLAVVIVVHLVSVARGDGGFLYRDDRAYSAIGERLSVGWSEIGWVNPTAFEFAGSYTVGYPMVVGFVFFLIGPHALVAKLLNAFFGAFSAVIAARIAGELGFGHRKRLVAWAVALCPTMLWWSGMLLKEELAAMLLLGAIFAALRLPRWPAAIGLALCLTALAQTRMPGFVAAVVAVLAIAAIGLLRRDRAALSVGLRTIGAIGIAVGVFLMGFSAGSPGESVAAYAQIVTVSEGPRVSDGGATRPDESPVSIRFSRDIITTYVSPYPWVFDDNTETADRGLYPGMWFWYLILPSVLAGVVALRRNIVALAALVVPVTTFALSGVLLAGIQFRQRSSIEALLLILAILGTARLDVAAYRGAAALALVALVAGVHTQSVPTVLLIAAAAGGVAFVGVWVGRRRSPNSLYVASVHPGGSDP